MIVGKFILGSGLYCINHEVGLLANIYCYVLIQLLVHTNVGYIGTNIAHKICLFLRIGPISNRDNPQTYFGALICLALKCALVVDGETNSPVLQKLPCILHCIVQQHTYMSMMASLR